MSKVGVYMKKVKKNNKGKILFYIIAVGCLIIFLLMMLSSILDIGDRLRKVSIYLEIAFYVVFALVFLLLIVYPIVTIVASPSLCIATSLEPTDARAIAIYKKVAKNIVKNNNLPQEHNILLTEYKNKEELLFNLQYVFEKSIKNELNKIILHDAKTVMISTAICQSARFDMMTVFAINLKMIKSLVEGCGYRPSMKNLSKLTMNVFGTALIAEGLENLKLEDIIPKSSLEVLNNVPYLGTVLESILQGSANAILTIRIGCVCRRYLFSDGSIVTKEDIRREAYKETLKMIPLVVAETISFFPKKVVKFFSKKKESDIVID